MIAKDVLISQKNCTELIKVFDEECQLVKDIIMGMEAERYRNGA